MLRAEQVLTAPDLNKQLQAQQAAHTACAVKCSQSGRAIAWGLHRGAMTAQAPSKRVAVIGAGISGLSAAYLLQRCCKPVSDAAMSGLQLRVQQCSAWACNTSDVLLQRRPATQDSCRINRPTVDHAAHLEICTRAGWRASR